MFVYFIILCNYILESIKQLNFSHIRINTFNYNILCLYCQYNFNLRNSNMLNNYNKCIIHCIYE